MRFNTTSKANDTVLNHEGAKAYRMSPEMELYAAIATTMLSDATYEKADERMARIISLLPKVKAEFVARLAVYARKQMNLRTAPVVLATELAKIHSGDSLVSRMVEHIVQRPDEIMELLAYYQLANKRTSAKKLNRISKQLQKGLAGSFNKFDEYQFAKYNRDAEVKLRDALFLVHPKAKDATQQVLFNKIAKQELATPYTWETELSALGQQAFASPEEKALAFTRKWEALIDSGKLGYMALLRNLRNILSANVSAAHIGKICRYLSDEKAVATSKQLPFRFLAAYRELKDIASDYTSLLMDTLETAITYSVQHLKGFDPDTKVVIACDVSGSMQKPVSAKSKVLLYDIGLLLGMLLQYKSQRVVSGMFGDTWKMVSLPRRGVLANVDAFYRREGEVGYATNGYLVLDDLVQRKYIADKVMIFTDVQLWDSNTNNASAHNTLSSRWAAYKRIAPQAKLYLFDLSGYGNTPLRVEQNDVHLVAGWSDKVFDVMEAMEHGADALDRIYAIEL
ncbi:TROVE domain-containing protein [uncultured Chitinophaga sp.]|jgi:TROVE domain.|uniref:TROVE domain-containing protein n=1 Tax=uncultured Chitinophaga sp. TaxID=339340 RepID=UPI00260371A0|nr:TROVE domain-containing protein [uncultured Chitinophaga sp.]